LRDGDFLLKSRGRHFFFLEIYLQFFDELKSVANPGSIQKINLFLFLSFKIRAMLHPQIAAYTKISFNKNFLLYFLCKLFCRRKQLERDSEDDGGLIAMQKIKKVKY
jgi:hypothetical protein